MKMLKVDNDLHHKLKYTCALLGMTMFEATSKALNNWLAQRCLDAVLDRPLDLADDDLEDE